MATRAPWMPATTSPYEASLSKWGKQTSLPTQFNPGNTNYGSPGLAAAVSGYGGLTPYSQATESFQMPQRSFSDFLVPQTIGERNFMGGMLGGKNADGTSYNGWGGMALGAAQGLAGAYMGMKNYGLAKQSLAQGKEQFERNYAAQKTTTNSALEDRQRARVASGSGYESVDSYMNKNRIV